MAEPTGEAAVRREEGQSSSVVTLVGSKTGQQNLARSECGPNLGSEQVETWVEENRQALLLVRKKTEKDQQQAAGASTMDEEKWYWSALWVNLVLAVISAASLTRITAPYGRHSRKSSSSSNGLWGPGMPARDGWVLMESPALWFTLLVFSAGNHADDSIPLILFRFFQLHYTHRVLIYPFRMRSRGKTISVGIVVLSFIFNVYNGYIQARWISHFGSYPSDWLRSPQFIIGSFVFITGMVTNIWADSVLISLRKPGEEQGGYKLPQGKLFELVACPNYTGEVTEWLGWAILTWSPAGLVFFIFTAGNLIPRAVAHRQWYVSQFPEFPASRKAIIPFIL